jgi:hypothetical protein
VNAELVALGVFGLVAYLLGVATVVLWLWSDALLGAAERWSERRRARRVDRRMPRARARKKGRRV